MSSNYPETVRTVQDAGLLLQTGPAVESALEDDNDWLAAPVTMPAMPVGIDEALSPAPMRAPEPLLASASFARPAPVAAAQPVSAQPASAQPASGQPASAQPVSAQPASGRSVSAPAAEATRLAMALVTAPLEAAPASWGWQARARRLTLGLVKPTPGEAEQAHRQSITAIRQATWTRSVNIMVTNPKGGTGKTPAALILAGILGHYRGGYVVAWEASESIGTLTRRAEGEPMRGLAELIGSVRQIRSAGNLGGYTAPQTSHADVIGSIDQRANLSAADVLAVREVLDTYYRISVTDTGNNPGHPAYRAALWTADAVVVPCLVSIDALAGVEEVLAVIDADPDLAGLRSRIVILLGHDGGPEAPQIADALRRRLLELDVASVVEVPFDPVIRLGSEITLAALSEDSNRAWTRSAAAVVQALRTAPMEIDRVAQARVPAEGHVPGF